jgi:hypothetical protein
MTIELLLIDVSANLLKYFIQSWPAAALAWHWAKSTLV